MAEPTDAPQFDFTGKTDDEIRAYHDEQVAAARTLAEAEDFSAEQQATFDGHLAEVDRAKQELSAREATAARRSAAASLSNLSVEPEPVTEPAPAVEPEPAPIVEPAAVVAAAPKVSQIAKQPVPQLPAAPATNHRLIVPGDMHGAIRGLTQGAEFTNMDHVGQALEKRVATYSGFAKGTRKESNVLTIQRDYGPEFTVGDELADSVLNHVRSERRLNGGSAVKAWRSAVDKAGDDANALTAAAGWCAPSETLYDLCELESMDGLLELPEISASRGGIRWTNEPTYAQLDAATTFTNLTEAQVIADTPKTCAEIPCPVFTDTRLGVSATCVTGSLLQMRGYPELVARFIRGAMVTHAHKLNEALIAQIVATAGAATVIATPADDATTSSVLSSVELAAEDIRYRNRMSFSDTIEVVLPHWVLPAMRADFARRNGGDPGLTNAQIANWFAIRSVRPQFVYDWQDFYSGVAAPSFGSAAPFVTGYPATVQFLAFPAGGVVLARQDVITLRDVYDSTNLQQNLFTALFFEEGWAPIYPCNNVRLYTTAVCNSGATGAQNDWGCVA